MSYVNFDLDALCSKANPSAVHFVMREWEKTESPSNYWYKKFRANDQNGELHEISIDDHIDKTYDQIVSLSHGLPTSEALTKCKDLYRNNIAKVTVQISEDSVLMTTRDFSVTFAEQLSIISMYQDKQGHPKAKADIFRWNHWTLHWTEPYEHC